MFSSCVPTVRWWAPMTHDALSVSSQVVWLANRSGHPFTAPAVSVWVSISGPTSTLISGNGGAGKQRCVAAHSRQRQLVGDAPAPDGPGRPAVVEGRGLDSVRATTIRTRRCRRWTSLRVVVRELDALVECRPEGDLGEGVARRL